MWGLFVVKLSLEILEHNCLSINQTSISVSSPSFNFYALLQREDVDRRNVRGCAYQGWWQYEYVETLLNMGKY